MSRTTPFVLPKDIMQLSKPDPIASYRDTFEDAKSGMMAAYATGDYTLQQIADAFGVHYATVSRAVNRG